MTGRKYHNRPGKASSARRRGRVSYPDSVCRSAPRSGRRPPTGRRHYKARITAADLLHERETGYSDGLTVGRREGEALGLQRAMMAVLNLQPEKPAGTPPAPQAKPIDYSVRDCQ